MADKKRRTRQDIHDAAVDITKDLIDKGLLIRAGFAVFERYVINPAAPQEQRDEMLLAWMAGAEHTWSSMLSMLDDEEGITDNDMRRMALIQKELDEWREIIAKRVNLDKDQLK